MPPKRRQRGEKIDLFRDRNYNVAEFRLPTSLAHRQTLEEKWALEKGIDNVVEDFPLLQGAIPRDNEAVNANQHEIVNDNIKMIPYDNGFPLQQWTSRNGHIDKWRSYRHHHKQAGRPRCHLRNVVVCFVRALALYLQDGRTRGNLKAFAIDNGYDVKVIIEKGNQKLTDQFLEIVQGLFEDEENDQQSNLEMQNFYTMISTIAERDFWKMQYHPLLLSTNDRLMFPANFIYLLDNATLESCEFAPIPNVTVEWQMDFAKWFESKSRGEKIFKIDCLDNVKQHKYTYVKLWKKGVVNREKARAKEAGEPTENIKVKSFDKPIVELLDFLRAVALHVNDHKDDKDKLFEEEIEATMHSLFPRVYVELFRFLVEERPEIDISLIIALRLKDRATDLSSNQALGLITENLGSMKLSSTEEAGGMEREKSPGEDYNLHSQSLNQGDNAADTESSEYYNSYSHEHHNQTFDQGIYADAWSSGYNNNPYPHEYYQNQTFVQGNYANTAEMSGYYPHDQYHNHTFDQGSYGANLGYQYYDPSHQIANPMFQMPPNYEGGSIGDGNVHNNPYSHPYGGGSIGDGNVHNNPYSHPYGAGSSSGSNAYSQDHRSYGR